MIRNRFIVNNSGNPERIGTKFYILTGAHMGRFPGDFQCTGYRFGDILRRKYRQFIHTGFVLSHESHQWPYENNEYV